MPKDTVETPDRPGRPETRTDTILVEGMKQPVRLRLVGEGLPFTTYVPEEEIVTEQSSSGEGDGVWFYANFAGKLNREAYLQIFIPSEKQSVEKIMERISGPNGLARSNGWRLEEPTHPPSVCPWAETSYVFYDTTAKTPTQGDICVGSHGGRAFYIVAHYPEEYSEGFMPRADKILKEMRWADTGDGLEKE